MNRLKKPTLCRGWRRSMGYVTWLAVPPSWTAVDARREFLARYSRLPAVVRKRPGYMAAVLVGPVLVDDVPAVRCAFDGEA